MKNSAGRDVSSEISEGSRLALDIIRRSGVEGFVFMEGSPSCGVYRTTLKGSASGKPPGAFGSLLLAEDLFLIPALDIESPWKWWYWSRRLYAFAWLKRKEISRRSEMYEAWHALKFMCQESDEKTTRELGCRIAGRHAGPADGLYRDFKKNVLMLLRKPSTLKRISIVMLKHYAYYRKHMGLGAGELSMPDSERGKKQFVEGLRELEKKSFKAGLRFGGYPVAYRPER